MPLQTADILIVGGGVVGSSTAYFLTAHPGFHGRVVVVEKDPTYGEACETTRLGYDASIITRGCDSETGHVCPFALRGIDGRTDEPETTWTRSRC